MNYDERREWDFLQFLGVPYPYVVPSPNWNQDIDPEKILVVADPHVPFHCDIVFDTVEREEKDAGTLIIPGDLTDYYSKARFRKTKDQSFKEEVRQTFHILEWASMNFREVKVMRGNHDNRPEKQIADLFAGCLSNMITLTERNLLERMCKYFPNVELVGTTVTNHKYEIHVEHIYQHGDIIFTHAEISRAQESAIMERISTFLHRWEGVYNLKPYRVIAQGHNHTEMRMTKGGERWFLLPTAAERISQGSEYIFQPAIRGNPTVVGYSVFYQKDGVTDYNRSKNVVRM